MDEILQRSFPTVLAPRFAQLQSLTVTGERFVLSSTKLMFEVSRPWLHAIRAISAPFDRMTPYGEAPAEVVTLRCGPVPKRLLDQFHEQSRLALPRETAAWIVWNENDGQFAYRELRTLSSDSLHVHFDRPALSSGWHLVMDIHSHGAHEAFFSHTDDADDIDQLCVSVVVGRVDQPMPSMVARLSMLGVYCPFGEI